MVGDVHGDLRAFELAMGTERFIVQLGDLTDYGPESAAVLRAMLALLDAGRGLFLLGNHDLKLARALAGRNVRPNPALAATIASIDSALAVRVISAVGRAPAWIRNGDRFFVHGAFHTAMLAEPPPPAPIAGPVPPLLARALYGETTSRMQADGYPERSLHWVEHIPRGLTVYCGHDRRSLDGRPYIRSNAIGGRAVFLDTGAGKGGHLAWIDL